MNKFLELLKKLGIDLSGKEDQLKTALSELEKASADEATALKAEIENLKKNNPNPPNNSDDKNKNPEILALQNELKELTALLNEKTKREKEQADAAKTKLEAERVKKINDLKTKGIAEGRITEATWEKQFKAIAEKDVDSFEALLPSLAVDPHFKPSKPKKGESENNSNNNNTQNFRGPLSGADKTILTKVNEMTNN